MKLFLSRSKTEKNYEPNKNNMFNFSTNKFKNRQNKLFNKTKNLTIRAFSNLEEEYAPRLKYKITEEDSLSNNKKNFLIGNLHFNSLFPVISKNSINIHNVKLKARKSIFLMRKSTKEDKFKRTKYEGKLENIYKENTLENKRTEIETKINKLKRLIEPLSLELSQTIKQIENYQLDLQIIKNFNFSESHFRKIYLSRLKFNNHKNNSIKNDNNNLTRRTSNSMEKTKSKEFETMVKLEQMKLQKRKVEITQKLDKLEVKKSNILIRLDMCEKNLKDLKKELKIVRDDLIKHYHKLLFEGKDTRNEGLSWIIRAIWKLKMNVIMSYLPSFLDEKSIEFLFKYSDKLVEIEQIQKTIEKKNTYLKNVGKKIGKLSEKLLNFEDLRDYNYNNNESEKNNTGNNNNIKSPYKANRKKSIRTPSMVLLKTIKRRSIVMNELTPMNALKRILSEADAPENFAFKNKKEEKESHKSSESSKSKSSELSNSKSNSSNQSDSFKSSKASKIEEETFKTSLYNQKKSLNNFSVDNKDKFKPRQTKKKIIKNLEMILNDPSYLDQLTSHLKPTKKLKISDYENMKNFKIEDLYDSDIVKIFNEYKALLFKLNEKKRDAEIFIKQELDRIGKCFYKEDYSGKYNTNLKTVIGALIGEDNSKLEVFRLQREQKEYFKTLRNLRTFNLLNKKIG